LPLIPGDLAHVHSLVPPVFSAVCEIVKVGMEIGGAVTIEAAPIQQIPEGAPAEVWFGLWVVLGCGDYAISTLVYCSIISACF